MTKQKRTENKEGPFALKDSMHPWLDHQPTICYDIISKGNIK